MNTFGQSPQDLGHAPGLCETSARLLGSIAIENFRNVAEPGVRQMIAACLPG
jgi:hypothetical protein